MSALSDFDPATPRPRWSLQAKAFAVTLALLAYVLGASVYVALERAEVFDAMLALDALGRHERSLALLEASIDAATAEAREATVSAAARPQAVVEIGAAMDNATQQFTVLEEIDASYALLRRSVQRAWGTLRADVSTPNWDDLRVVLGRVQDDLDIRHSRLLEERESLNRSYQRLYDTVTVESLVLVMIGAMVFGSVGAWFFASLTADIRRLEQHARQVVRGVRGVKLVVRRGDELGRLMHAVNRMAEDLDEREKQIELEAQRRSHQDKMLAVGALAAGVAHEVNNPLAVISGVAQEWRQTRVSPSAGELAEGAQLVLAQIERASRATRHLAEAAVPEVSELDWIDVNAIVRRAVQLLGYDKRYRRIEFETRLDAELPAVHSSGTAIQQVLMQMLSLGCDAMVAAKGVPQRMVIHSRARDGGIEAAIDFPPVLDFARPEVQRTLLLARAIVEPLRGLLAFGQADERGLRIKLQLPVRSGGEGG